jgi:uncharacterized protein YjbJ (UPF0337 family)
VGKHKADNGNIKSNSRPRTAGSRQQAAGSRQQAAGSRQQAAGSRQQEAANKRQEVDSIVKGLQIKISDYGQDKADTQSKHKTDSR